MLTGDVRPATCSWSSLPKNLVAWASRPWNTGKMPVPHLCVSASLR